MGASESVDWVDDSSGSRSDQYDRRTVPVAPRPTTSLVDRLTHRADVIHIQGDSWRRKEARERQARNQKEISS
jgi:hypothetical protein